MSRLRRDGSQLVSAEDFAFLLGPWLWLVHYGWYSTLGCWDCCRVVSNKMSAVSSFSWDLLPTLNQWITDDMSHAFGWLESGGKHHAMMVWLHACMIYHVAICHRQTITSRCCCILGDTNNHTILMVVEVWNCECVMLGIIGHNRGLQPRAAARLWWTPSATKSCNDARDWQALLCSCHASCMDNQSPLLCSCDASSMDNQRFHVQLWCIK